MNFIVAPLTTAIVFLAIYKIFDLIICRKERMAIIEKCAQGTDTLDRPQFKPSSSRFLSLRIGALLLGVGVGLVGGTFTSFGLEYASQTSSIAFVFGEVIMGGMVMLWGGLGLLISFIIERRIIRKEAANSLPHQSR